MESGGGQQELSVGVWSSLADYSVTLSYMVNFFHILIFGDIEFLIYNLMK